MNPLEIAKKLHQAAIEKKAITQFTTLQPFSVDEAYQIQKLSIAERKKIGDYIVGFKMGFTSLEKMQQMGVSDMIWGVLTQSMQIENKAKISLSNYIHPRIEPEIAFLTSQKITKQLTVEELSSYISHTTIALEIIDSRYQNFKFSLEDVIADNCSSSGFIIGNWYSFIETEVQNLEVALLFNNEVKVQGNTNAILNNPTKAIIELSRLTEKYRIEIPENSIILAGAATAAVEIQTNTHILCTIEGFEAISTEII